MKYSFILFGLSLISLNINALPIDEEASSVVNNIQLSLKDLNLDSETLHSIEDRLNKQKQSKPSKTEIKQEVKIQSKLNETKVNEELKEMICRVNKLRSDNGKELLLVDNRLMIAAQKHSEAQESNKKMSHKGFTKETEEFGDRFKLEGYAFTGAAENVAVGQKSVKAVMKSWEDSPGHRNNILGNYECFGYGKKKDYWTQAFASGADCIGYEKIDCNGVSF